MSVDLQKLPSRRLKVRQILLSLGVPSAQVPHQIHSKLIPWFGRVLDGIGVAFGGRLLTEEHRFVQDVAGCSSGADIEDVFHYYYGHKRKGDRVLLEILGLIPTRARVLEFYADLKFQMRKMEFGDEFPTVEPASGAPSWAENPRLTKRGSVFGFRTPRKAWHPGPRPAFETWGSETRRGLNAYPRSPQHGELQRQTA